MLQTIQRDPQILTEAAMSMVLLGISIAWLVYSLKLQTRPISREERFTGTFISLALCAMEIIWFSHMTFARL